MNINVNIKNIGCRYGTVGWLREQLESKSIWLEESNNYYIPTWGACEYDDIKTHGLVIRDGKHSALIAYRDDEGDYVYNVSEALGCTPYSHWCLNLTEAAKDALREICKAWIEKVESEPEK